MYFSFLFIFTKISCHESAVVELPAATLAGLTQSVDSLNEITAIRFVEAFNSQDYKLLRSQFAGPLKLLFNEKRAKEAFGTQLEVKGKITHYKIVRVKPNTLRMQLRYGRDTTEWNQLGMNFNGKNKMNGISFRAPSFRFQRPIVWRWDAPGQRGFGRWTASLS